MAAAGHAPAPTLGHPTILASSVQWPQPAPDCASLQVRDLLLVARGGLNSRPSDCQSSVCAAVDGGLSCGDAALASRGGAFAAFLPWLER